MFKATTEIHQRVEGDSHAPDITAAHAGLLGIVLQIAVLDIVFSLDSVITAVGMVSQLPVMIAAVVIAMAVMLLASGPTTTFVERHPTVKMLVFSFLLFIGMALLADGFGMHVPKGYIYAAIGFSVVVELLNQLAARRRVRARRSTAPRTPMSRHHEPHYPRLLRLLDALPHPARRSYTWLIRPEGKVAAPAAGCRVDCRRDPWLSTRAGFLDGSSRRAAARRGRSASATPDALRVGQGTTMVGCLAQPKTQPTRLQLQPNRGSFASREYIFLARGNLFRTGL